MDIAQLKTRLQLLDVACICDAEKNLGAGIRVVDPAIRPLGRNVKMVGTAHTVTCRNDFLSVIKGLKEAAPGDVLVIDAQGSRLAVADELFPTEATRRGLAGIVADGACRDSAAVRAMKIPYYTRWVHPFAGTTHQTFPTQIPVTCGGAVVHPGEVVFGDDDGIVVGTADQFEALIETAEQIQTAEAHMLKAMAEGASLFDMLNFDEHWSKIAAGEASKLKFLV